MNDPGRIFVRPAEGLLVRHAAPERGHVAAEGEWVPLTPYYRRRLADGDLVEAAAPAPDAAAPRPARGRTQGGER